MENIKPEVKVCASWEARLLAEESNFNLMGLPMLVKVDGLWTRLTSAKGWRDALLLSRDASSLIKAFEPYLLSFSEDLSRSRDTISEPNLIVVADDIASTTGPLFDFDIARESLFSYYTQDLQRDEHIAFHSDGDIGDLLPSIYTSGFSHVHFAGVDLEMFMRLSNAAAASSLVPIGGFGASTLSESELLEAVIRLQSTTGLIFADDAGLTTASELKQFLATCHQLRTAIK